MWSYCSGHPHSVGAFAQFITCFQHDLLELNTTHIYLNWKCLADSAHLTKSEKLDEFANHMTLIVNILNILKEEERRKSKCTTGK